MVTNQADNLGRSCLTWGSAVKGNAVTSPQHVLRHTHSGVQFLRVYYTNSGVIVSLRVLHEQRSNSFLRVYYTNSGVIVSPRVLHEQRSNSFSACATRTAEYSFSACPTRTAEYSFSVYYTHFLASMYIFRSQFLRRSMGRLDINVNIFDIKQHKNSSRCIPGFISCRARERSARNSIWLIGTRRGNGIPTTSSTTFCRNFWHAFFFNCFNLPRAQTKNEVWRIQM